MSDEKRKFSAPFHPLFKKIYYAIYAECAPFRPDFTPPPPLFVLPLLFHFRLIKGMGRGTSKARAKKCILH